MGSLAFLESSYLGPWNGTIFTSKETLARRTLEPHLKSTYVCGQAFLSKSLRCLGSLSHAPVYMGFYSTKWKKHVCNGLQTLSQEHSADSIEAVAAVADDNEEEEEICIEEESLGFLEWPSVCIQVGQFTFTSMATKLAKEARLVIGKSRKQSEELLNETMAACLLPGPLDFHGIVDVQGVLESARLGSTICTIKELCSVQAFLYSAQRIYTELQNASRGIQGLSPLLNILTGLDFCTSLEQELALCIDNSPAILDGASAKLASIRKGRRDNMEALESLLLETSKRVVASGGMDSVLVTKRRARLCIGVRASHRSLVPRGVVLDASNTGATLFMEPEVAIELNNKEVELASLERGEELTILKRLTCRVADMVDDISRLIAGVTDLDLACARAGYARWLGAVKPSFSEYNKQVGIEPLHNSPSFAVYIQGIRHPLLLGSALLSFQGGHKTEEAVDEKKPPFPVPIDLKVKSGTRSVILSGPNTGGKTATMKTLGICAMMAKAGLFLPVTEPGAVAHLPWFDKVLADIGDNQSLEQSLSTFSGHIKRLCKILEAGSDHSLVLLDEVGSGTDPSEGAALARAVLMHLADLVQLTLTTTHYAELTKLKEKDARFEFASLEFDIKTLSPTYNVVWGTIGQSFALDIAESLGFDTSILSRARYWVTKLGDESRDLRMNKLMDPLIQQRDKLQSQAEAAGSVLSEAKDLYEELFVEAKDLERREKLLRLQQEDMVARDISRMDELLNEVISRFSTSLDGSNEVERSELFREAQVSIASILDEYKTKYGTSPEESEGERETKMPTVGDLVIISSLGNKPATVIQTPTNDDDTFMVKLGSLNVRVGLSEIKEIFKQEKELEPHSTRRKEDSGRSSREEVEFEVAVPTSRNTLDLRGMRVNPALQALDLSLARRRPGSVLFVIHGMGTGVVKEAVLQALQEHSRVENFEQESPLNFGCTVVYIK